LRRPALAAAALGALALWAGAAGAAEKLRVVASLPDLAALARAIGGDLVQADSLARGDQNPHDIEVRPSLMVKLRRADLLVVNGVGGDPWVEPLLLGAGNNRLVPGRPGYVDASRGIAILGVPAGRVDRSMGDVHPEGNPHYTLDPANAAIVTASIVEGLARVAPDRRAAFEARRREFLAALEAGVRRWQETLASFRGARLVVYHDLWPYFLRRFGLVQAATVEDRPGIPPSPAHVAGLIRRMREEGITVLVTEPWADRRLVERIARESGARVVPLAPAVGAVPQATGYLELFDYNVKALAQALGSRP
jgi:ABC-type Zn uptake system ZnuABC Zn-binding protein ZnuA